MILVAFSAGAGTSTVTCSPAPAAGAASTAPGRTVITGTSALTFHLDGERATEDRVHPGAVEASYLDHVGQHARNQSGRPADRRSLLSSAEAASSTATGLALNQRPQHVDERVIR